MIKLLPILILLILGSCEQAVNNQSDHKSAEANQKQIDVKRFRLTVDDANYSMAYRLQYVLTEKYLKVIFKGELEGERDSTLFETKLEPSEPLSRVSNINIDNLQDIYVNPCVRDGSQLTVVLHGENKNKIVHLSNYYQADIGTAIDLINSMTPGKYKISYDKESLLRSQKNCKL